MTHLRQRMLEELQRRNYAENTIKSYLRAVADFARYFKTPPDDLGAEHLRQYHLYLIQERKLATQTVVSSIAALRFFYGKTLGRPLPELNLLNPKRPKRLPTVLGREEVARLLAAAKNLFQYTLLRTLYATALRRSELCQLKVTDIDSPRMMIHVRLGKANGTATCRWIRRCWRPYASTGAGCVPHNICFPEAGITREPTGQSPRKSCGTPCIRPSSKRASPSKFPPTLYATAGPPTGAKPVST